MEEKDTLYARWLEGTLSADEQKQLEESGALKELEAILEEADELALSPYDKEAGYARFKASDSSSQAKVRKLPIRMLGAIAAAVLFLIVLAINLLQPRETILLANYSNNKAYQFEDGSSVLLNDGSELRFLKKNWANDRRLKLEGEAYFEVEKGAPFKVVTSKGMVEVLGTRFNVRAWEGTFSVACYEGKVRVSHEGQSEMIEGGNEITIQDGKMELAKPINLNRPEWENGISRFEAEDIRVVFKELERQYNVRINIDDLADVTIPFTGSFPHNKLEKALTDICVINKLQFDFPNPEDRKTIIITQKEQ